MASIAIEIKNIYNGQNHKIWIQDNSNVREFLESVLQKWDLEPSAYEHRLYHREMKQFVDPKLSWIENQIVFGDHLLFI